MCTTTLENYFPYYNFTNGVKFIHFLMMPVILFGSIFSLTEIPVHYNPYNLTDIAQKTNINRTLTSDPKFESENVNDKMDSTEKSPTMKQVFSRNF